MDLFLGFALRFLLLLPAIVLHEISHGYASFLLGDPTAKNAGRLSLNPLKHIDVWGTLIMPAILLLGSGGRFAFGYAKPVPINPGYYKDYRKGLFLTGFAGPATNVVLAALSGLMVRLLGTNSLVGIAFLYFTYMNLVLVFFNLIPIPPLDGSRVIPLFLSDSAMRTYHNVEQYGFGILLVLVFVVPSLLGRDPIGWYFSATVVPLTQLFAGTGL